MVNTISKNNKLLTMVNTISKNIKHYAESCQQLAKHDSQFETLNGTPIRNSNLISSYHAHSRARLEKHNRQLKP